MYNSQELAQRIKDAAKQKNILVRDMLNTCELSINTLNQMSDAKGISSFSLAKIADYLECSVDYLLGRTDTPEINGNPVSDAYNNADDATRQAVDKLLDIK